MVDEEQEVLSKASIKPNVQDLGVQIRVKVDWDEDSNDDYGTCPIDVPVDSHEVMLNYLEIYNLVHDFHLPKMVRYVILYHEALDHVLQIYSTVNLMYDVT